jgi:hypothetical protein
LFVWNFFEVLDYTPLSDELLNDVNYIILLIKTFLELDEFFRNNTKMTIDDEHEREKIIKKLIHRFILPSYFPIEEKDYIFD